jgi:hypothetical protein
MAGGAACDVGRRCNTRNDVFVRAPAGKPGDTYTRQGYANRILREHGGNKTPIANPFAHWDPNFDQKLKVFKDAKPLGSDQHSMNEIHDHRSVVNDC